MGEQVVLPARRVLESDPPGVRLVFELSDVVCDLWRHDVDPAIRNGMVDVKGRWQSNNGAVTRRWALSGNGIAMKSWLQTSPQDVVCPRLECPRFSLTVTIQGSTLHSCWCLGLLLQA